MANPERGEVDAEIGGKTYTLCLTLGALAELEARLGDGDLQSLGQRLAAGRLSARDLIAILGAGLRGGGHPISNAELERLSVKGGITGAAEIAVTLLLRAFGED